MDKQPGNSEFDAIVVGSGPGGATVARELSRRGKRVLILERGGNAPLNESLMTAASILNVVSVGDNLAFARAFTTGGTTAFYFAAADPPPLDIFLSLGIDLSKELDDARKELPLTVLPDGILGARTLRLRESAMELGYAWSKSTMLVDLSKCGSGYTYEAKWNARRYVHEAVANGAMLINQARVVKVLVENDRAIGVEYKLHRTKKAFEVRRAYGTKIILAAGGATSPLILRDSGIRNVLNRGFYCHPNFAMVGTIFGLRAGGNFGASMGAVMEGDIGVGDGNFAPAVYRMVMLDRRKYIRALFPSLHVLVGVMVKEGLGGGLQENGRYYKQLTDEDRRKLAKGGDVARQIIQHAGGKHIIQLPVTAGGIGGTIRVREHLDESLQTEYANLHVCDASVIPESAKVTPTLTLICLGKYLANRLAPAL